MFIPITKCNDSTNNISDQLIPLEGFIDESYDRIKQNVIDKKLTDQLYKIRKIKTQRICEYSEGERSDEKTC